MLVTAAAGIGGAVLLSVVWLWKPAPPPPAPRHPADTMDGQTAWSTGFRLVQAGRYTQAIPYYRRAARLVDVWQSHFNLAAALMNAAHETHRHLDVLEPALRSSFERQDAVREAFREMDRCDAATKPAAEQAFVLRERARIYLVWGLPVDALREARRAADAEPVAQNDSLVKRILTGMVIH